MLGIWYVSILWLFCTNPLAWLDVHLFTQTVFGMQTHQAPKHVVQTYKACHINIPLESSFGYHVWFRNYWFLGHDTIRITDPIWSTCNIMTEIRSLYIVSFRNRSLNDSHNISVQARSLFTHLWCRSPWWRREMETFSALLALWAGNSPVTGEFHAQRPVTRRVWYFLWSALE